MLDFNRYLERALESLSFTLLLLAIAALCFTQGPLAPFSTKTQPWTKHRVAIVGTILVVLGATPLIANKLEVVDLMNWLPAAFEWPAGFAPVASMPGGVHIVSLIPTGRIQIYDRDWRFVRGWHVTTFGDVFRAAPIAEDRIEVVSEHGLRQYVFSLSGDLIATESYAPVSSSLLKSFTKSRYVPTHWWLFPFSDPSWSIPIWAIGVGMLGVAWWRNKRPGEGRSA